MTREQAIAELVIACRMVLNNENAIGEISREGGAWIGISRCNRFAADGTPIQPGIFMDIPVSSLTDEQSARAKSHFALLGFEGPISLPCTFDGEHEHFIHAWAASAGECPKAAAELIVATFEAVFDPPAWPEYEVSFGEARPVGELKPPVRKKKRGGK